MKETKTHRRLKPKWQVVVAAIVGCGLLVFLCSLITVHFLVDWWWFDSVGYTFYFWQRLLYKYAVFAVVAIAFFLVFYLNFRFASRFLGKTQSSSSDRLKKRLRRLRIGSRIVYIPLSLALAAVIALPLFRHWHKFLFFAFGPQSGIQDPVFAKDISYYLFSLPIYSLIQQRLLLAFAVLLLGLGFLYWLEYRYARKAGKSLPHQITWHLGALIAIIVLIRLWGTSLWLHSLVYTTAHEPMFYGPGFIEKRFIIPLTWAQMVFLAGAAIAFGLAFKKGKRFWVTGGILAGCFLLVLGVRHTTFFQKKIEKYIVKPNQLEMEKPFIKMNIQATLNAYGLSDVVTRDFRRKMNSKFAETPMMQQVLRNVPLWDKSNLAQVYRELEELRTYYNFPLINVGRYSIEGRYQQVFLASRELNYARLPGAAKNWVNEHLTYTHGYGLVITPASQEGDEPIVWIMHGIPLKSDYDLAVKRPEIYFGTSTFNNYVIAPSATAEIDYPQGNGNVTTHYKGHGGVALSSLFRQIIFAYFLKDRNILISQQIADHSRILFIRNIVDRIRKLAPFLLLDRTPYLAMTSEKLYWIQDAYTISEDAPDSQPIDFGGQRFNYMRNSVKIVVDAYDGAVDFYVADPADPIIRTYSRMYPGLFRSMSMMPADLKAHLRYPKDLFQVQMRIYAKYHQTDPQTFYLQEDTWEFSRTVRGSNLEVVNPYYLSLNLIEPAKVEFSLMQPMTPRNRDNLRAIVAVGCDGDDYGKIIAYYFPKGELVYSPAQIDALINADPGIVKQFNLWDMKGSQMERGKMIILPAGKDVYYIQPVFLMSETNPGHQIPQLQRIVITQGQVAVMESNVMQAYRQLNSRLAKIERQMRNRFELSEQNGSKQAE
ncbi:MAG: UPF0182 family protein [Deltaproteobacteria bacterium]